MTNLSRRSFFKLAVGAAIAPVVAKASVILDPIPVLYGDGIHDDTLSVQALIDGKVVEFANPEMAKGAGWFGNPLRGDAVLLFPKGFYRMNTHPVFNTSEGVWINSIIDGQGSTILRDGNDHKYGFELRNAHSCHVVNWNSYPFSNGNRAKYALGMIWI